MRCVCALVAFWLADDAYVCGLQPHMYICVYIYIYIRNLTYLNIHVVGGREHRTLAQYHAWTADYLHTLWHAKVSVIHRFDSISSP